MDSTHLKLQPRCLAFSDPQLCPPVVPPQRPLIRLTSYLVFILKSLSVDSYERRVAVSSYKSHPGPALMGGPTAQTRDPAWTAWDIPAHAASLNCGHIFSLIHRNNRQLHSFWEERNCSSGLVPSTKAHSRWAKVLDVKNEATIIYEWKKSHLD